MNENLKYLAANEDVEFPIGQMKIEVTEEKPYTKCFSCKYFQNGCSGPDMNIMTAERVCEFLQLCRIKLHYTYQKTADLSGLSLVTVKRTLTGKNKDPGYITIQALFSVLVADPDGKHHCAVHIVGEEAEKAKIECDRLRGALDEARTEYAANLAAMRSDDQHENEYLRQQIAFKDEEIKKHATEQEELYEFVRRKNRVIGMLAFVLAVCVITIITAHVIDHFNHDGGFWLENMSEIFGSSPTNIKTL